MRKGRYFKRNEISTIMKKTTFFVRNIIIRQSVKKTLQTGAIVSFLFMHQTSTAAPTLYTAQEIIPLHSVVTLPVSDASNGGHETNIEIFANDNYTSVYRTVLSFNKLIERYPEAVEMEPVMRFIADGIGNICIERVSVDCDTDSKVLNVAYRLPGNMLLSIRKPLCTMSDPYVMFNVYHLRKLLISDSASIDLLAQYMREVESHYSELA